MVFLYDESGAPVGLQYRNTGYAQGEFDTYYYEKNIFGDIVGVYTQDGTYIGGYIYDAWGNFTASTASGTTALQKQIVRQYNPFRYRGYYYDVETMLYYLQSRYYDPATGRFINADGYINGNGDLIGYNMYAYCSNNPVMNVDPTGDSILIALLIGGAVGVVSQYVSDVVCNLIEGEDLATSLTDVSSIVTYAGSAISGALSATGISVLGSAVSNATIDGIVYLLDSAIHGEDASENGLILHMALGASGGIAGGKGANLSKFMNMRTVAKKTLQTATTPKRILRAKVNKNLIFKKTSKFVGESILGSAITSGLNSGMAKAVQALEARFFG